MEMGFRAKETYCTLVWITLYFYGKNCACLHFYVGEIDQVHDDRWNLDEGKRFWAALSTRITELPSMTWVRQSLQKSATKSVSIESLLHCVLSLCVTKKCCSVEQFSPASITHTFSLHGLNEPSKSNMSAYKPLGKNMTFFECPWMKTSFSEE